MTAKESETIKRHLIKAIGFCDISASEEFNMRQKFGTYMLVKLWIDLTGDKGYIEDICRANGISSDDIL